MIKKTSTHNDFLSSKCQVYAVVFVMLFSYQPPVLYWSMHIEYVMIRKHVRFLKCVSYCCWLNPNHPWLNPWIHYICHSSIYSSAILVYQESCWVCLDMIHYFQNYQIECLRYENPFFYELSWATTILYSILESKILKGSCNQNSIIFTFL